MASILANLRGARPITAVDPRDDRQVERALKWILAIAIAGIVVIAILALGRPENLRTPFFGIAVLAAFTALGAGAALGLLFGLPWRSDPVAVVAPTPTTGGAGSSNSPATAAAPTATGGWYKDNTSLEQIAQWLTTSIVALTLVNYDGWVSRFESAATAVTCSMYDRVVATPAAQAAPVSAAGQGAPAVRGSPVAPATSARPVATAQAPRPTPAQVQCGLAPGGIVLAMYALLGLLAGYLWSRRYLMKEFSSAIHDASRVVEQGWVDRASASNLVQSAKPSAAPTNMNRLREHLSRAGPLGDWPPVEPGELEDDPWKGQFGGQASNDKVRLSATVTPLVSRPGQYRIDLLVSPLRDDLRSVLATQPARVYLHPTFGDPVRTVQFDLTGQIQIPLIAYGAFTVGLQLWDDTRVELDLAQLPDAPAEFRAR